MAGRFLIAIIIFLLIFAYWNVMPAGSVNRPYYCGENYRILKIVSDAGELIQDEVEIDGMVFRYYKNNKTGTYTMIRMGEMRSCILEFGRDTRIVL